MIVVACIVSFIIGGTVTIGFVIAAGKHLTNMTFDEVSRVGEMLIDAGNNRVSTLTLCTDSGYTDVLLFEKE